MNPRCKEMPRERRRKLTGVQWRWTTVHRCVRARRDVGVWRLVGVHGSVRRRAPCSVRSKGREERGKGKIECGGEGKDLPPPLFINGPEEIVRAGFTAHDLRNWRGVNAHDLAAIFGNCSHTARSAAQTATGCQRCGAAHLIGCDPRRRAGARSKSTQVPSQA